MEKVLLHEVENLVEQEQYNWQIVPGEEEWDETLFSLCQCLWQADATEQQYKIQGQQQTIENTMENTIDNVTTQ